MEDKDSKDSLINLAPVQTSRERHVESINQLSSTFSATVARRLNPTPCQSQTLARRWLKRRATVALKSN